MVEVTYSQQLQQWSLEKSLHYAERSDSAATTPDLDDHDRVDFKPTDPKKIGRLNCHEPLFQERYLSSEEDLSPTDLEPDESIGMDGGGDDDFSFKDVMNSPEQSDEPDRLDEQEQADEPEVQEPTKTCDLAVVVSYVAAGRPKVIDLPLPTPHRERGFRSASLANLPSTLSQSVPTRPSRLSLVCTATTLPIPIPESPRPSTARACSAPIEPVTKPRAASRASLASLPHPPSTARSSTSSTSSSSSGSRRPSTSRITSIQWTQPFRSSFAALSSPKTISHTHSHFPLTPITPSTPVTPMTPSFLDSDPFANTSPGSVANSTSMPKHRRLRSISRTLSLAKIAVHGGHSHKKEKNKDQEAHSNGGRKDSTISISAPIGPVVRDQPWTPATPVTPLLSPGIAAAMAAGRRFSQPRMMPRATSDRAPPPDAIGEEIPPRPLGSSRMKMVPRGAGEREPMIELPPFPMEENILSSRESSPRPDKSGTWDVETKRKVRKRKSLLGLV